MQTESEKQIDKLRRKEEKRHKRGVDQGIEDDFSCTSFSSLLEASERKNLFDDVIGTGPGPQSLTISALPQGTVRKHFKGYEEVIIPPIPTAPMKPGEKLVFILLSCIHYISLIIDNYNTSIVLVPKILFVLCGVRTAEKSHQQSSLMKWVIC